MATMPATRVVDEAPGMIATVAQVDAWMEHAKAGDVFVYVTGTCLPMRSGGAKRMRELAERKLVDLSQKRLQPGGSIFNYRAQRTSTVTALTKPERPTLIVPQVASPAGMIDGEVEIVDKLLPVLERFARSGRPCPTDKQLAARARLSSDQVKAGLQALAASHAIHIQGCAAPTMRRITILATGHKTGLAA
jgi:hypothetical protein